MIQIFKNLLSEEELTESNNILCEQAWGFGYISTDSNKPIWNFNKETGRWIAERLASKVNGYNLDDYHINGQTMYQDGSPHTDSYAECTHSLVWFPQKWDYTWGGRLHIFTQDGVRIITPEENLAVLFPADLVHYAEGPRVQILRISIGLKLNVARV